MQDKTATDSVNPIRADADQELPVVTHTTTVRMAVDHKIQEFEDLGIIEIVEGPTPCVVLLVAIPNVNGKCVFVSTCGMRMRPILSKIDLRWTPRIHLHEHLGFTYNRKQP